MTLLEQRFMNEVRNGILPEPIAEVQQLKEQIYNADLGICLVEIQGLSKLCSNTQDSSIASDCEVHPSTPESVFIILSPFKEKSYSQENESFNASSSFASYSVNLPDSGNVADYTAISVSQENESLNASSSVNLPDSGNVADDTAISPSSKIQSTIQKAVTRKSHSMEYIPPIDVYEFQKQLKDRLDLKIKTFMDKRVIPKRKYRSDMDVVECLLKYLQPLEIFFFENRCLTRKSSDQCMELALFTETLQITENEDNEFLCGINYNLEDSDIHFAKVGSRENLDRLIECRYIDYFNTDSSQSVLIYKALDKISEIFSSTCQEKKGEAESDCPEVTKNPHLEKKGEAESDCPEATKNPHLEKKGEAESECPEEAEKSHLNLMLPGERLLSYLDSREIRKNTGNEGKIVEKFIFELHFSLKTTHQTIYVAAEPNCEMYRFIVVNCKKAALLDKSYFSGKIDKKALNRVVLQSYQKHITQKVFHLKLFHVTSSLNEKTSTVEEKTSSVEEKTSSVLDKTSSVNKKTSSVKKILSVYYINAANKVWYDCETKPQELNTSHLSPIRINEKISCRKEQNSWISLYHSLKKSWKEARENCLKISIPPADDPSLIKNYQVIEEKEINIDNTSILLKKYFEYEFLFKANNYDKTDFPEYAEKELHKLSYMMDYINFEEEDKQHQSTSESTENTPKEHSEGISESTENKPKEHSKEFQSILNKCLDNLREIDENIDERNDPNEYNYLHEAILNQCEATVLHKLVEKHDENDSSPFWKNYYTNFLH